MGSVSLSFQDELKGGLVGVGGWGNVWVYYQENG